MADGAIERDPLLNEMLEEVKTLYPEISKAETEIVWQSGMRDLCNSLICGCCDVISIYVNSEFKKTPEQVKGLIAHEFSEISKVLYGLKILNMLRKIPVFGTIIFPLAKNYIDCIADEDLRKRLEQNYDVQFQYHDHVAPFKESFRSASRFLNYYRERVMYNSDSIWLRRLMKVSSPDKR